MSTRTETSRPLKSLLTLAALCALALTLSPPNEAAACGGCFAPTGSPTVVTRHQMAVSISGSETTLWDQIEYGGAPDEFVWVLPVRGGVAVELADNAFFEALEQTTEISLQGRFAPLRTWCPDPCGPPSGGSFGADAGAAADASASPVTVHHQASIGPYETVTIGSTDPDALVTWLRDHGYAVPDSILPTVRYYVDEGMDFAVLRLAPGAGVNQMTPVRVTMPGTSPIFPLRMVAAGIQEKVGLELFVIGEGRYEAGNFTNSEVDRGSLAYDYDTGSFNYDELWEQAARRDGGRAWVTEYAMEPADYQIRDYRSYDDDGVEHSAAEDWSIATRSLSAAYVTRMTADLAARYLNEDLILQASTGGDLSPWIEVTRERNRPAEPTCSEVCTDPRGMEAGGPATPGRSMIGEFSCSLEPGARGSSLAAGLGLLALGLFLTRRRQR